MRASPAGETDLGGKNAARNAGAVGQRQIQVCPVRECVVSRVYVVDPIVSVKVMGAELSRPRSIYEGGVGPRLEDVGVTNAGGVAALSQEQHREHPSRSEHSDSARRQDDNLSGCRSVEVPFERERHGPGSCYTGFAASGE